MRCFRLEQQWGTHFLVVTSHNKPPQKPLLTVSITAGTAVDVAWRNAKNVVPSKDSGCSPVFSQIRQIESTSDFTILRKRASIQVLHNNVYFWVPTILTLAFAWSSLGPTVLII